MSAAAITEEARLRRILAENRRVAIVGLSPRPARPSHGVGRYMIAAGYEVLPVTPSHPEVLGIASVPDLAAAAVAGPLEIVDIFRRIEAIPEAVDAAIASGARVVWMQRGLIDEGSAARARAAGLEVVMDRCIKVEHARLIG